jgi:hypothetical protein
MTTHLGLQRILLPSAQVSQLTTGSITLPSARTAFTVPGSYESIASVYLSSGDSSAINFTDIPATFQHLEIRFSAASNRTSNFLDDVQIRFGNGSIDTGANYAYRVSGYEDGGPNTFRTNLTAQTSMQSGLCVGGNAYPNGIGVVQITNYANTNTFKGLHGANGFSTNDGTSKNRWGMFTGSWASTSAITHIRFSLANSDWKQYSRVSLYGIKGS